MEKVRIATQANGVYNLTETVRRILAAADGKAQLCTVVCLQPAAGIFLSTEEAGMDIMEELRSMVPARYNYQFKKLTPTHMAGIIKSAILGNSVTLAVEGGKLLVGEKTRILLAEFDGPRTREYAVQIL